MRSRLQIRRRKLGLTQTQLARQAKLTQPMISMIETGKLKPSVDQLERIEIVLTRLENGRG